MAKDSQVDNKFARMMKSRGDVTTASEEGKNHNRTAKKQSIKPGTGE